MSSEVKTPQEYVALTIDMLQEDFEKSVQDQQVNVGQMQSMILWFEAAYAQCRANKDGIIDRVCKGVLERDDPLVTKTLNGLYVEMTKIEQKVTFLKTRRAALIKKAETPIDT